MTTCASGTGVGTTNTAPVHYEIAPNYHATYTEQAGASIERQLLAGASVTLTYLHSFGVHQQVLRNANQAIGGTPQTSSQSFLYQYFPEAIFKQNQIIASFSARAGKNLSLSGFYTYSSATSNGAGPDGNNAVSNAYDLDQDYGRAGFVLRNVAFLTGTYNGPWGLTFNPFLVTQSGRPFNITLAADPLNNLFNQRPTYATTSTPVADQVVTPFGVLDSAALAGETLVPVNRGSGPAAEEALVEEDLAAVTAGRQPWALRREAGDAHMHCASVFRCLMFSITLTMERLWVCSALHISIAPRLWPAERSAPVRLRDASLRRPHSRSERLFAGWLAVDRTASPIGS
jgi:hypothetical protein